MIFDIQLSSSGFYPFLMTLNRMRKGISSVCLSVCLLIALSGCSRDARSACEWPCFHGPDRTNKSPETGLLKEWPDDGPGLLWKVDFKNRRGLNIADPIIKDNHVFFSSDSGCI
ncbi:MAG TPA: hypothetical protein ENN61_00825 [Bacteroidaceae bacterium]|nr:hypothetical protein [Bacteroidaceae bacterium]